MKLLMVGVLLLGMETLSITRAPAGQIYDDTFSGTISTGLDTLDVFGDSSQHLNGDAFTATIVVDPSNGVNVPVTGGVEVEGGTTYSSTGLDPIESASLTINGNTVTFDAANSALLVSAPIGSRTYFDAALVALNANQIQF